MAIIGKLVAAIKKFEQAWFTLPLWEKPDGRAINAQADADGNLYVNVAVGGGGGNVQGVVSDHDPVGVTMPVVIGGVYMADPTINTLDDGDAGWALLNDQRMLVVEIAGSGGGSLVVEDIAYDPVTDANKVVPVVQTFDNHEPFDQSQAVATAAVVTHYIDARTFPFWSMIWSTLTGGGVTIEIEISASNETTEPDLTLRSYEDITTDLYGGPIVLTAASAIALGVDTPLIYDSYRIQYTPSALATWTAEGKKGSF